MAAARHGRPDPSVVERLQEHLFGPAGWDHVLIETKLPTRFDDAPELGQSALLIRYRAEHETGHGRVDRPGLERELVGRAGDHSHPDGCARGGPLGRGSQGRLGLDRDHLVHCGGVMGKVAPGASAQFDHGARQRRQELAPVLGAAAFVRLLGHAHVHAGEAGMTDVTFRHAAGG